MTAPEQTWTSAADALHLRVVGALDGVLARLAELHRPHTGDDGMPTCLGCDTDGPGAADAVWPCRTYTIIARAALGVSDVEAVLLSLRRR